MALDFNQQSFTKTAESVAIDEGLRAYMLKVYNYMTTALLITGFVAYFFGKASMITNESGQVVQYTEIGMLLFGSPLAFVIMFAPLIMIFFGFSKISTMSVSKAQTIFWVFSFLMGLSMASIFIAYTEASITRVFFICSGTFAATSLYGYTTKRDLTALGSFLFMGLIGLIITSIVNWFLQSPMLYYLISAAGVLIFVGLTAYDTQKIKNIYNSSDAESVSSKKAIMGALSLYLDFINLFVMLLRLFGQRR
ncbi:Bax inhibitor-1/YccA family protein [Alphaproteobacteria bacterium]|nr:Bax inhibitor-1/YccA family protein [Alphaproteobacteria bacterium]